MILRLAIVIFACWPGLPGAAAACPDHMAVPAEHRALTGRDLWSPEVIMLRAGGGHALPRCGFDRAGHVAGHVRGPPDLRVVLTRMGRYDRLHLRANAECDTVLLLRDPRGRWFFDDDSGTGLTASLSIAAPGDGAYAIWVGTYSGDACAARLTLETF